MERSDRPGRPSFAGTLLGRLRPTLRFWIRPYGLSTLLNVSLFTAVTSRRALITRWPSTLGQFVLLLLSLLALWLVCDGLKRTAWSKVEGSGAARLGLAVVFSFAQIAPAVAAVASLRDVGTLPNDGMLLFAIRNRADAIHLVRQAMTGHATVQVAIAWIIVGWSWHAYLTAERFHVPTYRHAFGLVGLVVVLTATRVSLPVELSIPAWLGRLAYYRRIGHEPAPRDADVLVLNRMQLAPSLHARAGARGEGPIRPNIVLFRLEEVAADRFGLAHPEIRTTPVLAGLGSTRSGTLLYFRHHYTNAGATDVSIPTIMNGLSPSRSGVDIGHVPLLWQYLRALGYDTSYVSAFDMRWGRLDRTLSLLQEAPSVDRLVAPHTLHASLGDDTCVPDAAVSDAAVKRIEDSRRDEPFFMAVDYCLTHFKGVGLASLSQRLSCHGSDYDCAIYETDHQMGLVIHALAQHGLLDHTLLVGVSDHGTNVQHNARLVNFYQEVAHVPLFVFVPSSMAADMDRRFPRWRQVGDAVTANIDVVPTVVDLVGGRQDPTMASLLDTLDGVNVFSPRIHAREWIEMINTNALRRWFPEGYALLYRGRYKMIYFNGERQVYDLQNDPDETHDLLKSSRPLDPLIVDRFREHIGQSRRLTAIESDE